MQITARESGQFELKVRDAVVLLGTNLSIGDYVLPGPGEYEIAGIMAEVTAHTVRFVVDDFQVGFLRSAIQKLPDQELEQVGNVDILFAPVGFEGSSGLTPKELISLANQVEARLIVPIKMQENTKEGLQAAFPQAEVISSPLKITRSQLPEEGSRILVFD
ncbi:MAG: MBL fold metallo-hydrolase [Patescibacteria group bacterium]